MHDNKTVPFSAEDFRARVRAINGVALQEDDDHAGDHLIDPTLERPGDHRLRDAAVLIPVIARRPEATVLFTQRTEHLPSHAGQIAFPGGKIDAGDASPLAAALRETEEEIGLDRAHIEPVGCLEPYLSNSGYRIVPVLAVVETGFELNINYGEVADAFEVPLSFLMSVNNHRQGTKEFGGIARVFYEMPYGERYIWGVTAGIVRRLYERLYG